MNPLHNPIRDKPKDPYEGYKTEEIQPDKRGRDHSFQGIEKGSFALGAYLLLLFQKFLHLFAQTSEEPPSTDRETSPRDHLILLKAAFEILKTEDRSQDVDFLNRLSELWHQVLEDSISFSRASPSSKSFRVFIRSVQHYPETEQHSLGYYLTEYAGQKWLPFPYMELISKIHTEHSQNPSASILTLWTKQIDELCKTLA